ncbi:MAG: ABC transporter substrate-binding protein, partial [Actinomycetia bacterium]|nr:ABC transporter substrate-binding protein [Actinomycetes bacterium]
NDTSEVMAMREDIMNNDVFKHTDAVKGEEIYLIESDLIAFYWFISLQYMAKWFYPELFADLDPKAIHQEFLTEFQGLDYNLEKNGVFAYPES